MPGKFGRAGSFDGKRTVVAVTNCGFQDDAGTLEAWIWMPAQVSAMPGTILRLDGGGPWTYHIVQRDENSSGISYTTYDGSSGQAGGPAIWPKAGITSSRPMTSRPASTSCSWTGRVWQRGCHEDHVQGAGWASAAAPDGDLFRSATRSSG